MDKALTEYGLQFPPDMEVADWRVAGQRFAQDIEGRDGNGARVFDRYLKSIGCRADVERFMATIVFSKIVLRTYLDRQETERELDRIFGPAELNSIWPGGIEALKRAGFTRMDDIGHLSDVLTKLPLSAYTDYFLTGIAGGWSNGPHPNTKPVHACKWILKSAEFIALLRIDQMVLNDKEREVTGFEFPDLAARPYKKVDGGEGGKRCKEIVDKIVKLWQSWGKARHDRNGVKEEAKAANKRGGSYELKKHESGSLVKGGSGDMIRELRKHNFLISAKSLQRLEVNGTKEITTGGGKRITITRTR